MKKRIRIETGARLHFGLLDTAAPFGGIGVMVDAPSTVVEFSVSDQFKVDESIKSRALPIAVRIRNELGSNELPPIEIRSPQAAPAHSGFGSGTQLSLAIADGLRHILNLDLCDEVLATQIADRAKRSAVGVHGYFHGGLIFESANESNQRINPIQSRIELPDPWRLVLLRPTNAASAVSGSLEAQQFSELQSQRAVPPSSLRELITKQILPAAIDGDFASFSSGIQAYNHASGMLYASAQGGPYNGATVTELVTNLKSVGAVGVGQSSWGPGVFAWCESETDARELADRFKSPSIKTWIARVKNSGRQIQDLENCV